MTAITTRAPRSPSARINVLEVVGNAIVGGVEMVASRLCAGLPRDRFKVVVACPFDGRFADQLRATGLEVVIVQMADDPSWVSIQALAALVAHHRIDVMHAHLSNAHMLAGLVGKLTGTPVVATIHGRAVPMPDLEVQRLADTHLGLVCQPTLLHAVALGVEPSRLHLIPNGVDTATFTPDRRQADGRGRGDGPLRRALGVPAEAPLIAFVGRLSPEKGPEVFLRTALEVLRSHPDARFAVIGDGPQRDSCERFVAQHGLQERVRFAGMQHDMPAVYAELDIVVSTSHAEAMPLALMEAMASGVPVVASRVGGVADLVAQGISGCLVNDNDVDGFAWNLDRLLRDREARSQMGDEARRRVTAHFSLADSIAKTAALFERLARQTPSIRSLPPLASARTPRFADSGKAASSINIGQST